MNIVLVYNPKSGSALTADELRQKCKKHGIIVDSLVVIDSKLKQRLTPFIKNRAVIAAIGGDGTLSAVAACLMNTQAVFAPLPGGTLNHFTKDLGIPQDIDEALHGLVVSKKRMIDTATVNERVFINNASIGLYPSSLHERNAFEGVIGKWPAAVIASVRTLVRFRTYAVEIDGKSFRTPFVFVGNNTYKIDAPGGVVRHHIDQGVLSVFIAHTSSRWVLAKIALWTLVGRAKMLDEFTVKSVEKVSIKMAKRHMSVSCDGEVYRMTPPLKFEVQPKALSIRY